MDARVEAVMEMAKTWPTEDKAELLDALFGLVSPAGGELEGQWINECEARCAAIDSGGMPGLGYRFTADVDEALDRIQMYPLAWHPLGCNLRRCHFQ
jgi:hypothetical protein